MQDTIILQSKLIRPNVSNIIKRTKLRALLNESYTKRLVTVVAGAGYGKSTLVNRGTQVLALNTIWYRLDQEDSDLTLFIRYLIAGIRNHYPEFGNRTLAKLSNLKSLDYEQKEIINTFISETELCIKNDITIVLDDYHLIDQNPDIIRAIEHLIEYVSPKIHLVIVSRKSIDLNLSRLRTSRELYEITEKELSFGYFEIEQLYGEIFNIPLSTDTVKLLKQKTGGWITGLILYYLSSPVKTEDGIKQILYEDAEKNLDITIYMNENIFSKLPDTIQMFLLKTSILSRFNDEICNDMLSIDNASDLLKLIKNNHLFICSYYDNGHWYYYHHLFQAYLTGKLGENYSTEEIKQLHSSAGELWLRLNKPEEALNHYIIAEDYLRACEILNTIGKQLRYEGKLQKLIDTIESIPPSYIKNYPWILYTSGYINDLLGRHLKAIRTYIQALEHFSEAGNEKGAGACLNRLINDYGIVGDFKQAEAYIRKALALFDKSSDTYLTALGFFIMLLSLNRKMDEAEARCHEGLLLADQRNQSVSLVWFYYTCAYYLCKKGDFIPALQISEDAKKLVQPFQHHPISFSVDHILSWLYYNTGQFDHGRKVAISGLKRAKKMDYNDFNVAWLNVFGCMNSAEMMFESEAIQLGIAAREGFKQCGSLWGQAFACHATSIALHKIGRLQDAEAYARDAVNCARKCNNTEWFIGIINSNLARLSAEKGLHQDLDTVFDKAEKGLSGLNFYMFRLYLWKAKYLWHTEKRAESETALETALKICIQYHYEFWLKRETAWIIHPLVSLFSNANTSSVVTKIVPCLGLSIVQPLIQYTQTVKKNKGIPVLNLLREIQSSMPKRLTVNCLGPCQVFIGDMEITDIFWKSQNSKTLLKFLTLNNSSGFISKDILIELLWPDMDPDKTTNSLYVALNSLRKTLEPSLPARAKSSFLLRYADTYRLSFGEEGGSDINSFHRYLKKARSEKDLNTAIDHYHSAEKYYRGDLFLEDPYADWCISEREAFRQEYSECSEAINEYYFRLQDIRNGLHYSSKLIRIDPLNEQGYRYLMKFHGLAKNTPMIHRTYDKCKLLIEKELDCPVSDETNKLYQQLIHPYSVKSA